MPTPTSRDQRSTDRRFRQLTRELRPASPVVRHWPDGPSDGRDLRITGHGDRRCPPAVAAAIGSILLALVGVVLGDSSLAVGVALIGLGLCSALGSDQARTHLTVTHDGHVVVGNGVHRRVATVPAIAVARLTLPVLQRSRWDPRRPVGQLLLHGGELLPVRALAYDPSRVEDHQRASALLGTAVAAIADSGAVLDIRSL